MDIAITKVLLGPQEEQLVLEVLRSGQLAQGPMVERLEAAFSELAGVRHAVAVSSGTAALVAALQALELEEGDEVITSPFTFVATLNAILEAGAVARFADIGADYTIDVEAVERLIGPRTKAIMPVHLYGLPADMSALASIAAGSGLAIVEDAAQAIGARVGDRSVGSFGLGCFSLYATKNVTTGEGGVITTDDPELARRLRVLRNQGMQARYDYVMVGHNYRMTDLQAAVGVAQMERLGSATSRRQANAAHLDEALAPIPGIERPHIPAGRTHVYHQYTIRVLDDAPTSRDELAAKLTAAGIGSGVYYPRAVYDYDCYRSHPGVMIEEGCEIAERFAAQVLSLPVHPGLVEGDISRIAAGLQDSLAS